MLFTDCFAISRCEVEDYFRYGFQHYLKGHNNSAFCFLFYINDEVVGYCSVINAPFKGHNNSIRFHRVSVLPQFRGKGIGNSMINFVSAVLVNENCDVYMKTQNKSIGHFQGKHTNIWQATQNNKRKRRIYPHEGNKYKHRLRKACYSHKYIGKGITEYSDLFIPLQQAREKGLMYKRYRIDYATIMSLVYPFTDRLYINDYFCFGAKELKQRYDKKYNMFYSTSIPVPNDDVPYILLPDNYIEIRQKKHTTNIESIKRLLYINALLRRFILPTITFEHLLHCLLCETEAIDKLTILNIAYKAFNADKEKYTYLLNKQPQRSFKVNDNYCKKNNVTRGVARNMSRTMITHNAIAHYYDYSLTDAENIEILRSKGVLISIKTLQRYRKLHNLMKYKK